MAIAGSGFADFTVEATAPALVAVVSPDFQEKVPLENAAGFSSALGGAPALVA